MVTKNIILARIICHRAHGEQVDKGGNPYFLHPEIVATQCNTEKEKIVALLHDVVEDTDVTLTDLASYGFGTDVINAIDAITKRKGEPYQTYLKRVKQDPIARVVKLADLWHNSQLSRLNREITPKDIERVVRYQHSIQFLQDE